MRRSSQGFDTSNSLRTPRASSSTQLMARAPRRRPPRARAARSLRDGRTAAWLDLRAARMEGAAVGRSPMRGIEPGICTRRSTSPDRGNRAHQVHVRMDATARDHVPTAPISTMRPAYMTATRSAVSAITPMSCVTSMIAVPCSRDSRLQQRDDLRLHRDIERGRRFVGDDQLRIGGERQRDHHALAHAAGELVRIMRRCAPRPRAGRLRQQRDGALRAPRAREGRCVRMVSISWSADAVERIEAGQRVLKHHADPLAADVAHRLAAAGRRCARPSSRIAPPAIRPGGSSSPMIASPVNDLPAPISPTTPSTSPRAMSNETSSTRPAMPRRAANSTREMARRRAAAALTHRNFGLSASRSQSPRRLTDSTSAPARSPGKIAIHHSPANRKSLPIRIRVPSEGCVGGSPTPRNDSVASV